MEIISAFKEIRFPKTKSELLLIAETKDDISEASTIALNRLDDRTFNSIDEICSNVKIVCDLEIYDALREFKFPASKEEIRKYMESRNCSKLAIQKMDELHPDIVFNDISDVCK